MNQAEVNKPFNTVYVAKDEFAPKPNKKQIIAGFEKFIDQVNDISKPDESEVKDATVRLIANLGGNPKTKSKHKSFSKEDISRLRQGLELLEDEDVRQLAKKAREVNANTIDANQQEIVTMPEPKNDRDKWLQEFLPASIYKELVAVS